MAHQIDRDHQRTTSDAAVRMAAPQIQRRHSKNSYGLAHKRRSTRVEKPRSQHQSPKVPERRRTLTTVKQYASLEDHYRAMFGGDELQEYQEMDSTRGTSTRPFSWHPSTSRFPLSTSQSPIEFTSVPDSRLIFQCAHDVSISEMSPQSVDMSPYSQSNNEGSFSSNTSATFHQDTQVKDATQQFLIDLASQTAYSHESTPRLSSGYAQSSNIRSQPADAASQNRNSLLAQSPDLQDGSYEMDTDDLQQDDGGVLVGMGLYDPPDSTPPPFGASIGKGLKLEETWHPPKETDADADAKGEDSSDDEEEELPKPVEPHGVEIDTIPVVTMASQSFFFEDDETVSSEWWYQQLKQPTARDAGIGCGWLQA